jgi:hypothetical protein
MLGYPEERIADLQNLPELKYLSNTEETALAGDKEKDEKVKTVAAE